MSTLTKATKTNINVSISHYINKEMSGSEFNKLFPDIKCIKLTNKSEIHNEFMFKDGLNIDIHDFNHDRECSKGGFYFTKDEYICDWIYYNNNVMCHTRKVTIPDDAYVFIEAYNKFKTNKFILEPKESIGTDIYMKFIKFGRIGNNSLSAFFDSLNNQEIFMEALKFNGLMLKYTPSHLKTIEMCVEAVKEDSYAIAFVPSNLLPIVYMTMQKDNFNNDDNDDR